MNDLPDPTEPSGAALPPSRALRSSKRRAVLGAAALAALALLAGWNLFPGPAPTQPVPALPSASPGNTMTQPSPSQSTARATFGGGCFWCTEAVFQQVPGVRSVVSGYSGGHTKNPTYYEIGNGDTGHAECIQIEFDPGVVSYPELLQVFFRTHDPTTLNRQGNDRGTQYRSVIFHHDEQQREDAARYLRELSAAGVYSQPVVTQLAPLDVFYPAEDYHQNYYRQNSNEGYCRFVIAPKLAKFQKEFAGKVRPPE